MPPGLPADARIATHQDALDAYDRYLPLVRKRGYQIALAGSTLIGDGLDIDLIVVPNEATVDAADMANELVAYKKKLLYFEAEDDGSEAVAVFIQHDDTVVDFYVIGILKEEE